MDKTDHLNFVSHEVTISKQTNKKKLNELDYAGK